MSNIPKPSKLPKAKSVTSTDHNSIDHETLLNTMWVNIESIFSTRFAIPHELIVSLKNTAITNYLNTYKERIEELQDELSTATAAQKSLINTTVSRIHDYVANFKAPVLDASELESRLVEKIYQQELLNEKNISVGYVDIYAQVEVVRSLYLNGELLRCYMPIYDVRDGSNRAQNIKKDKDDSINRLCDIDFKAPEWRYLKDKQDIYIDVRASIPTLAQLTRELLVIKSYIPSRKLAVVFKEIDNPIMVEVLDGHEILSIDLSHYTTES